MLWNETFNHLHEQKRLYISNAGSILGPPITRKALLLFSFSFPSPPCSPAYLLFGTRSSRRYGRLYLCAALIDGRVLQNSTPFSLLLWQLPVISSINSSSSSLVSTAAPRPYVNVLHRGSQLLTLASIRIHGSYCWCYLGFLTGFPTVRQSVCPQSSAEKRPHWVLCGKSWSVITRNISYFLC